MLDIMSLGKCKNHNKLNEKTNEIWQGYEAYSTFVPAQGSISWQHHLGKFYDSIS